MIFKFSEEMIIIVKRRNNIKLWEQKKIAYKILI